MLHLPLSSVFCTSLLLSREEQGSVCEGSVVWELEAAVLGNTLSILCFCRADVSYTRRDEA